MSDFDLIVDSSDVVQAGKDLLKMGQDSENMAKSAQSSASVFVSSFNRIEKQIDVVNRANLAYTKTSQGMYNSVLKVGTASKSAADSAKIFERDIKKQEVETRQATIAANKHAAELERLSQKYKPLYASSMQYERSLNEIEKAQSLGIITTQQHSQAVEELNRDYQAFQSGTAGWSNQFVQGSNRAGKSVNRFGMYAQQVGYQVGDFFVQVQSGQSAMVAFAQQGTQLAGLLPGVAGAIVGIGLSLGGMIYQMLRAKNETKGAGDAAETFEGKLKSLNQTLRDYQNLQEAIAAGVSVDELFATKDIGKAEGDLIRAKKALGDLKDVMSDVGLAGGQVASATAISEAVKSMWSGDQVSKYEAALQKVVVAQTTLNELQEKQAAERLNNYNEEVSSLRDIEDLQLAALKYGEDSSQYFELEQEQRKHIYAQQVSQNDMSESQKLSLIAANNKLIDMQTEARTLAGEFANTASAAGLIASALNAIRNAEAYSTKVGGGRGFSPGATAEEIQKNVPSAQLAYGDMAEEDRLAKIAARATRKGGKGGGKSAKAERQDFVQGLRREFEERRKLLTLFGEQRTLQEEILRIEKGLGESKDKYSTQAIANIARENLLLKDQEDLYQESLDNMQDIYNTIEEGFGNAFMSVLDGTESVKDAFKSMAKSVIDQLLQIIVQQKIVGSFGGSSGGGGSGLLGLIGGAFGGFFADGGDVGPNVPIVVGEKEPELFVPRTAGTIYNQKQLAQMGNGSNGGKQQIELILHAPDGVSIETVRSEVGLEIRRSAPKIVSASVSASQNSLKNGPKGNWGL